MKKIILLLNTLILLPFLCFGQHLLPKLDDETAFFMEINGANLNSKINWEEFNQYDWVKELYQKSDFKDWSDFSQTGIDYSKNQYQYYTSNDSIYSYVVLMAVKDADQLEKFVTNSALKGIEVEDKGNYKMVPLWDDAFVAWNETDCVVVSSDYKLSYNFGYRSYGEDAIVEGYEEDYEIYMPEDSIKVFSHGDSLKLMEEHPWDFPSDVQLSNPKPPSDQSKIDAQKEAMQIRLEDLKYDKEYVERELKYAQDDVDEFTQRIKELDAEILDWEEKMEYFDEHGKLPYTPLDTVDVISAEGAFSDSSMTGPPVAYDYEIAESIDTLEIYTEEDAAVDKLYVPDDIIIRDTLFNPYGITEKDSINYLNIKAHCIGIFDEYFDPQIMSVRINSSFTKMKDAKSDIYIWSSSFNMRSMSAPMTAPIGYYGINYLYSFAYAITQANNVDYFGNLYFDTDKVVFRVNQEFQNPKVQQPLKEIYTQKFNKKLLPFISEDDLINYSLKINTEGYFDFIYNLIPTDIYGKNKDDGVKIEKGVELFLETMKIALDEKAIAEIAPGNAVFSLHSLHEKEVTYTTYDYDEDFNYKEVEKIKTVYTPNFTLALITENPDYWDRFFAYLTENIDSEKITFQNGTYSLKMDENEVLNELHFTQENGVVLICSSLEGIKKLTGAYKVKHSKEFLAKLKKNNMYGSVNIKDLLIALENELQLQSSDEGYSLYRYLTNNVGDLEFETNYNSGTIESEMSYKINSQHSNSLMYFFNLFEEIYHFSDVKSKETQNF